MVLGILFLLAGVIPVLSRIPSVVFRSIKDHQKEPRAVDDDDGIIFSKERVQLEKRTTKVVLGREAQDEPSVFSLSNPSDRAHPNKRFLDKFQSYISDHELHRKLDHSEFEGIFHVRWGINRGPYCSGSLPILKVFCPSEIMIDPDRANAFCSNIMNNDDGLPIGMTCALASTNDVVGDVYFYCFGATLFDMSPEAYLDEAYLECNYNEGVEHCLYLTQVCPSNQELATLSTCEWGTARLDGGGLPYCSAYSQCTLYDRCRLTVENIGISMDSSDVSPSCLPLTGGPSPTVPVQGATVPSSLPTSAPVQPTTPTTLPKSITVVGQFASGVPNYCLAMTFDASDRCCLLENPLRWCGNTTYCFGVMMFESDQLNECCDAYPGCQEIRALVQTLHILRTLSFVDVWLSVIIILLIIAMSFAVHHQPPRRRRPFINAIFAMEVFDLILCCAIVGIVFRSDAVTQASNLVSAKCFTSTVAESPISDVIGQLQSFQVLTSIEIALNLILLVVHAVEISEEEDTPKLWSKDFWFATVGILLDVGEFLLAVVGLTMFLLPVFDDFEGGLLDTMKLKINDVTVEDMQPCVFTCCSPSQ